MKILLVCNAGMSTGIMQLKLIEQAKINNIEADVEAVPVGELSQYLDVSDCILLGPQVRFMEEDVKKMVNGSVPVILMNVQDFGLMRADKIFAQVLKAVNE